MGDINKILTVVARIDGVHYRVEVSSDKVSLTEIGAAEMRYELKLEKGKTILIVEKPENRKIKIRNNGEKKLREEIRKIMTKASSVRTMREAKELVESVVNLVKSVDKKTKKGLTFFK